MSRAIVRVFKAGGRAGGAAQGGEGEGLGERRHYVFEVQWQGRGGTFRHIALGRPGARRVLRASGIAVAVVLTAFAAGFLQSSRAPAAPRETGLASENTILRVQRETLRGEAFDLSEQLVRRVEQARRLALKVGVRNAAWEPPCPSPPAVDVEDKELIAWLTEQGVRLDPTGNAPLVDHREMGLVDSSVLSHDGTELDE